VRRTAASADCRGSTRCQTLRADPPEDPAHPDVRADQPQLAFDLRELEVVHPHDLRAVRIDDLLVEKVAREAEGLGRQLLVGRVREARAQPEVPDLGGEVGPAQHLLAVPRREDRPLGRGELALRDHRDVRELPHLVAVRFDHRPVLDLGQIRHCARKVKR